MIREPDLFLRRIRTEPRGPLRKVLLEQCAHSQECRGAEGEVCPHCHGAVLTREEKAFLAVKRIESE